MFQDRSGYNRVCIRELLDQQFHRLSALKSLVDVLSGKLSGVWKLPKLVEYIVPTVSMENS